MSDGAADRASARRPAASPQLDLDWEQGIFRGLSALWRRFSRAPDGEETDPGAAWLEPNQVALGTLAQLIAGEPVRIRRARSEGGVRGADLLLPDRIALAPDPEANRRLYVVRTAISAAVRRLTRGLEPPTDDAARALASLRVAGDAAAWLRAELPSFEGAYEEAVSLVLASRPELRSLRGRERALEDARRRALRGERPWEDDALAEAMRCPPRRGPSSPGIAIWGDWMPGLASPEPDGAADEMPAGDEHSSEAEAPALDELRRVVLDPKEKEDAVLVHVFEKVETADSYRGGARDTDGSDELDAHLEALEEVELGDMIRGEDPAHALLRADLQMTVDIPDVRSIDSDERGIAYDEWDLRARRYRKDWCTVYPAKVPARAPAWGQATAARHRRLIAELRRRLEIHRYGRQVEERQLEGDDIDVGAVVDAYASFRAGRGHDPRLYVRHAKRRRDFATTLLLDVSLSSDSWVQGRRVLDVSREAVLVLGEVADQLGDRLQVLAFASHTRNVCRVWELKGWREPWLAGRDRLGALEPQGYTRIGPALRHASAELAAAPADRRLLLLVSDGKPTDYDRYEGRYGVADVRQALREAERLEICPHALAVDAVARDYLPPMFGPGAWHVLPHPERLPEVLTSVYGRLTAR